MAVNVSTIWLKQCYLAVENTVLPVRMFNTNFVVGGIPTCEVTPVTGMSAIGAPPSIIDRVKNGSRAVLYLSVNGVYSVIFAGYVMNVTVGTDIGGYRSGLAYQVIITLSHNANGLAAYAFGQRNFLPFGAYRDTFYKENKNVGINIERLVETEGLKNDKPAVHCKEMVEKILTWYQQQGGGYPNTTGIIRASAVKFKDIIRSAGAAKTMLKSGITQQTKNILTSTFGSQATAFDLLSNLAQSCFLTLVPDTYYVNVIPSFPMQAFEKGTIPEIAVQHILNTNWISSLAIMPTTCVWVPRRSVNRNTAYQNPQAPYNPLTQNVVFNRSSFFRYPNKDTSNSLIMNPPGIFTWLLDMELNSSGGKARPTKVDYTGARVNVNLPRVQPKEKVSQAPNDSMSIGQAVAKMLYASHAYASSQVQLTVDPAFNFSGRAAAWAKLGRPWAENSIIGLLGRVIAFQLPMAERNKVENEWFMGYVNNIAATMNRDASQFYYRIRLSSVRPYSDDGDAITVSENPLFDNVNANLDIK